MKRLSLSIALLALSGALSAQPPAPMPHPGMMHPGMQGGPMMRGGRPMPQPGLLPPPLAALELDEAQRKKVEAMFVEQQAAQRENIQAGREAEEALRELYAAEVWDAEAIGKVYGRIFALKREMIVAGVEARNRLMTMLNEEQRARLRQMMPPMPSQMPPLPPQR